MEKILEIYNKIWIFVLETLKKAGITPDFSNVPEWLNIPSIEA